MNRNIDLFAEHMCPKGAVHVPYRGAMRVCKRLKIDYAEAVVGFEFGNRMAVPVIQGVVVAEENQEQLMVELEKDEAERLRKEDEKRRKAALGMWRKFIMGLRIVERIRQDYGEIDDSVAVFGQKHGALDRKAPPPTEHDEDMAGGFLPEGYEEEGEGGGEEGGQAHQMSSFFPVGDENGDDGAEEGGLIMEDGRQMPDDESVEAAEEETDGGSAGKSERFQKGSKPKRNAAVRRSTRQARRKVAILYDDDSGDNGWQKPDEGDE